MEHDGLKIGGFGFCPYVSGLEDGFLDWFAFQRDQALTGA